MKGTYGQSRSREYRRRKKNVPYKVTVARGESVWDACARVASDKDHMQELVYNTLKENHIKDPGNVQPGQELIIKVKAAGHVRIDDTSR